MITINNYQLHSVVTGNFALDGGAMFGIIPKVLWEKKFPGDERNRIDMVTRSLLIIGNERKILVDVGNGDKWDEKSKDIYKIDTETTNIEAHLQKLGLGPQDITDVIITHLHFDHAGGATKMVDGQIAPAFPNARYYVQKKNYEWANAPSEKDRGSYLAQNWQALADHKVLELVDGPQQLFAGIELLVCNGHTYGQQLPLISDGQNSVLYCGDLFPTHAHIPLPWVMAYDLNPIATIEEKKQLLPRAVAENWLLFYEHDAKYTATHVIETSKGFAMGEAVSW